MPKISSRPMRVYMRSQLMSMSSSSMGYTPSWSSPQNSSAHAGSALQRQRVHSFIPEVPDPGSPLVGTDGPASRASRSSSVHAVESPVGSSVSSPTLQAKKSPTSVNGSVDSLKQITSVTNLKIDTINL